jgi:hypothetical protein
MITDLQKFFKNLTYENIRIWCEALDALEPYYTTEKVADIGEYGIKAIKEQIELSLNAITKTEIKNLFVKNAVEELKANIENRIIETREQALDALKILGNTELIEGKVKQLSNINKETSSILSSINNKTDNAIPMIFAVFSRKNDYYGLGSQGTDTSDSGGGRTL